MNVLVVGGHGQIAIRLLRLLAERGDQARGMIRKPDQAADLEKIGAEPVVLDIEEADDISAAVEGSDAVVVLKDGAVVGTLRRDEIGEDRIMELIAQAGRADEGGAEG